MTESFRTETCPQPLSSLEELTTNLDTLHNLNEVVSKLSTYLEHAEHCEPTDVADIDWASDQLLSIASSLSEQYDVDIGLALLERLNSIRTKRGVFTSEATSFAQVIEEAETWRMLQVGQFLHDKQCHTNVINNIEDAQLRHYTLHLAKLPFHFSAALQANNMSHFFESGRFADLIAFGLKLATLRKRELPETPFNR